MPVVPFIPAIAAGVSAVGGIVSGNRASAAADRSARQQQRAADSQTQIARDQLDFGREQYSDWRTTFQPALRDLVGMAQEEQRPDYGGIAADVGQAFDASQGINRRQMERFGVQPTDGASQASETQYGLGRALAQVGAFNTARQGARDSQFNRLLQVGNVSSQQQAQATNSMQGGFGALQGAFGNQANMYGQRAGQYANAAAAGAQMAGYGLNQMMSLWPSGGSTAPVNFATPGGYSPVAPSNQIWPGGG